MSMSVAQHIVLAKDKDMLETKNSHEKTTGRNMVSQA